MSTETLPGLSELPGFAEWQQLPHTQELLARAKARAAEFQAELDKLGCRSCKHMPDEKRQHASFLGGIVTMANAVVATIEGKRAGWSQGESEAA